jgi:hypothetical protein
MAPQAGLEPATLRLTAPEICFLRAGRCVAMACDGMLYVAPSPVFSAISAHASSGFRKRASETDCDQFLRVMGKELGKEKGVGATVHAWRSVSAPMLSSACGFGSRVSRGQ